jgi:hypothetical protein
MMKATAHLQEFSACFDCMDFSNTEKASWKDGTRGGNMQHPAADYKPFAIRPTPLKRGRIDF